MGNITMRFLFVVSFVCLAPRSSHAHQRLVCPPPRSGNTGAKSGPCDAPDNLSQAAFPLQGGTWQTVVFEESIFHAGAPQRLALAMDGEGNDAVAFETCVLLDHIPHNDAPATGRPSLRSPSSYTPYRVSVFIPDISCERCTLQLISAMTDAAHGVPPGT